MLRYRSMNGARPSIPLGERSAIPQVQRCAAPQDERCGVPARNNHIEKALVVLLVFLLASCGEPGKPQPDALGPKPNAVSREYRRGPYCCRAALGGQGFPEYRRDRAPDHRGRGRGGLRGRAPKVWESSGSSVSVTTGRNRRGRTPRRRSYRERFTPSNLSFREIISSLPCRCDSGSKLIPGRRMKTAPAVAAHGSMSFLPRRSPSG